MPLNRVPCRPVIERADIPGEHAALVDVSAVFNPGAVEWQGGVLLLLRVQNRGRETLTLRATSGDGIAFEIDPEPVVLPGLADLGEPVHHVYDPRITPLAEGGNVVVWAVDLDRRCALGSWRTDDFRTFELLGPLSAGDNRNGVLFPERVGGRYLRLDRPNRVLRDGAEVATGDEIWLSESDDLASWRPVGPVAAGRPRLWDELLGPGPPPVRTEEGWLLVYHGIATRAGGGLYQAGVMLLDLEDPSRVVARGRYNILEPREQWEVCGQVPNVVFPSGIVIEPRGAPGVPTALGDEVFIYYGAADTCVARARTTVAALVEDARAGGDA